MERLVSDKKLSVSKPIYRNTGYLCRGYKLWIVNVSDREYKIFNWISRNGTVQYTTVDDSEKKTIYDSRDAGWRSDMQGYRNAIKFIKNMEGIA